jgi:hypothetical protein
MKRQLHLNLFIHSRGHHEASWRHRGSSPPPLTDIRYYQDLAQRAETALFDSLFLADQLALGGDVAQAPRTVWASHHGIGGRFDRPPFDPPTGECRGNQGNKAERGYGGRAHRRYSAGGIDLDLASCFRHTIRHVTFFNSDNDNGRQSPFQLRVEENLRWKGKATENATLPLVQRENRRQASGTASVILQPQLPTACV